MNLFEDKMSKQHEINEDHASDPKIGDFWSEMFAPILVVVGRPNPDSVLICDKMKDVGERRWTWDLTQCRIMTLEEFHARLRYDSIPGFWADCCPEHMTWVKERAMELMFGPKEEEATVTDKPGIRYPGDDDQNDSAAEMSVEQEACGAEGRRLDTASCEGLSMLIDRRAAIASLLAKISDGHAEPEDRKREAVSAAEAFLDALPGEAMLPTESIYHCGDKEVLLQWKDADDFIEIGLPGDGTISWCSSVGENKRFADQEFDAGSVAIDERLSGDIVKMAQNKLRRP